MNTRQFSPLTSTTMKREREEVAMESANCLMLISRVGEEPKRSSSKERMYKCKTCNREFPTFQALGGHRASHKKPRLEMSGLEMFGLEMSNLLVKHKMHECSICGLEFPIGQALGGHMRRHRAEMVSEKRAVTQQQFPGGGGGVLVKKKPTILISHNNNNNGMVCLDLNLSPFENDLSLKLGLMACAVDLA